MGFLKDRWRATEDSYRKPVAAAMAAALMSCALASTAVAASHHPKGEFTRFSECPLGAHATVTDCVYATINGGSFKLGKKSLPVTNAITLQGGFEGAGSTVQFFGAENGATLSKSPQPVPGGLLGLRAPTSWPRAVQEWFNSSVGKGLTAISATVELAAPATSIKLDTENLLFREGTALGLPVKIHLENPMFGGNCYVGSNSKPIQIDLTTGMTAPLPPNKPITGLSGHISFNKEFTLLTDSGLRLVNNSFAVSQGASGCGGSLAPFLDPLVDSVLGAPAAAGQNTAILESVLGDAGAEAVRNSE